MKDDPQPSPDKYFVPPSPYDEALTEIPGLTWLPWVGANYPNLPPGRKVLVVGESHYARANESETVSQSIKATDADPKWTRTVVKHSLILNEWDADTLVAMHRLFHDPVNRAAFWDDLSFYNHVQRCMGYEEVERESPTREDYRHGWRVFLKVVEALQPDHVLYIGVEASNQFNHMMNELNHQFSPVHEVEKVGSTWARVASVSVAGRDLRIHFIKHSGRAFSPEIWSEYLHRNAGELMSSIAESASRTI